MREPGVHRIGRGQVWGEFRGGVDAAIGATLATTPLGLTLAIDYLASERVRFVRPVTLRHQRYCGIGTRVGGCAR